MKKTALSIATGITTLALLVGTGVPANAAYSKGIGYLKCTAGNGSWWNQEIHIASTARGSITHTIYRGTWYRSIAAGSSANFTNWDTHFGLQVEMDAGNVRTSYNYSSDIQQAYGYCV